jgi:hypothetical protein
VKKDQELLEQVIAIRPRTVWQRSVDKNARPVPTPAADLVPTQFAWSLPQRGVMRFMLSRLFVLLNLTFLQTIIGHDRVEFWQETKIRALVNGLDQTRSTKLHYDSAFTMRTRFHLVRDMCNPLWIAFRAERSQTFHATVELLESKCPLTAFAFLLHDEKYYFTNYE